ncbi:LLM class flavin-dependent oxidoreductase [Nocardia sp. BMG111209]|uniref:LLM class flavin-dependent oxidoreductase n=1 Tax=Nocardia sp. BMG111209 TaxID=1160137 RepID=UPI0003618353|nr:LLM class flavin-dependent oxidoreductase [Nocardia sp. BMG111209]
MFTLRFDMRAPEFGAPPAALYGAAVDMCAWAESRGAALAVLSEHHGAADGHLPAPLLLASAIAARTRRLPILLAAVVLPLRDPVLLAEEINVLDLLSGGRVSYAFGIGHRAEEYEQFGVDLRTRGRRADDHLALLLDLLDGRPHVRDGRRIHVTPHGKTASGPTVMIAGGSRAAARRAARHGLGFVSQSPSAELAAYYRAECVAHGRAPGFVQTARPEAPTAVFVADDVERAWADLGPHLLHDATTAAAYRPGDEAVASISRAATVDELRDPPGPYRVLTLDAAAAAIRAGGPLPLLPLCGGLPPEVAWTYLENAATAVERARRDS